MTCCRTLILWRGMGLGTVGTLYVHNGQRLGTQDVITTWLLHVVDGWNEHNTHTTPYRFNRKFIRAWNSLRLICPSPSVSYLDARVRA